jgi:putative colanic acid biosynthesis glycosyltransferase
MLTLSIVTITYNDLSGLKRTISSIDACLDSYAKPGLFEHVVIDGNSSDGTRDFLHQIAGCRKTAFRFVSEPDRGIYDAMNKGVQLSWGAFVVFLNAGDQIAPGADPGFIVATLLDSIAAPGEAGIALSSMIRFARKSVIIPSREVQKQAPRLPTVHQSMFFKHQVLLEVPFDTSYRVCGDYDNFARIFSRGLTFRPCQQLFSVFYAGGVSSRSPAQLFWESSLVTAKYFGLGLPRRVLIMGRLLAALTKFQLLLLFCRAPKNGS